VQRNNTIRSITIGSFDGIHLAHQKLISQAEMIVVIERNSGYLTPGYKRSFYADKPITFYYFNKIRTLNPAEFVARLREDFPKLEKIVIGYDFHFGRDKSGDATLLHTLFKGEVVIVEEISLKGIPVHSKTIKALLRKGDIETTNAMLDRPYRIDGEVIPGQGLGSQSLVPTLNIHPRHYQLPHEGVYATRTKVAGRWLPSVSFIGHRVSTDGSFAVETHIIGTNISILGGDLWIEFVAWLRPNRKFDGLPALKQQIDNDIQIARRIL